MSVVSPVVQPAKFLEILRRQVRSSALGVFPYVAENIGQLEGEPQGVGVLGGAGGFVCAGDGSEDAEREPPDGTRHTAAVRLQVVPRLVGDAADVHEDAVDQLVERVEGDGEPPGGVAERDRDRVGVVAGDPAVPDPREQLPGLLQALPFGLRGEVAVADVVDPPGEGVQRGHGVPFGRWQQPDAVGEVAGLLPGDGLAVAVGGDHLRVEVLHRAGRGRVRSGGPRVRSHRSGHPSPRRLAQDSRRTPAVPARGAPDSTS